MLHAVVNRNVVCVALYIHMIYIIIPTIFIIMICWCARLIVTGHSLGAALASIMAYETLDDYDVWLINFGSPRVGNPAFVKALQSIEVIYRVVHYYDIVPHTPEEALGYLHLPYEIWYDEANEYYVTCTDDFTHEDDSCSNSCAPIHCTSTSDHLNYLGIPMGSSSDGLCWLCLCYWSFVTGTLWLDKPIRGKTFPLTRNKNWHSYF